MTGPRIGRRGKAWKQVTLTPEQARMVDTHRLQRRWTFQTLADEAFKLYFLSQGQKWPESMSDEQAS